MVPSYDRKTNKIGDKKRNDNFKDPTGKGKGKVIASIFRKTRAYHDLKI